MTMHGEVLINTLLDHEARIQNVYDRVIVREPEGPKDSRHDEEIKLQNSDR